MYQIGHPFRSQPYSLWAQQMTGVIWMMTPYTLN